MDPRKEHEPADAPKPRDPPDPRAAMAPEVDTSKENPQHFRPMEQLHPDRADEPKPDK